VTCVQQKQLRTVLGFPLSERSQQISLYVGAERFFWKSEDEVGFLMTSGRRPHALVDIRSKARSHVVLGASVSECPELQELLDLYL